MKKILFVCSGNICCSVMAQYMMKPMTESIGLGDVYQIDAAAAAKVHAGEDIYPEAKKKLEEMGVPAAPHKARMMTWDDYDHFDYLIGMDETNIDDMRYIVGSDPAHKIHKLGEFFPDAAGSGSAGGTSAGSGSAGETSAEERPGVTGQGTPASDGVPKTYPDIEDPWYTDDFDTAYREIQKGLMGLLTRLS